jgi:hypothetical protein
MYTATGINKDARIAPNRNQEDRRCGQLRPNFSKEALKLSVNHFT